MQPKGGYIKNSRIFYNDELWCEDSVDNFFLEFLFYYDREDLIFEEWEIEQLEQPGGELVNKQIGYGSFPIDKIPLMR